MKFDSRGTVALAAVILSLAGCDKGSANVKGASPAAATVIKVESDGLKRITLKDIETRRLGIQFAEVTKIGERLTMPYKALLYDPSGGEWAFMSPEANVYTRTALKVESIDGETVYLAKGPPPGTKLVTAGAAQLYGIDFGIGK